MKNLNRLFVVALCGAGTMLADVTYTEQVHFNGGTLIDMMKNMQNGPMAQMQGQGQGGGQGQGQGRGQGGQGRGGGGQAFQDQSYTIYIKGNKMARVGPNNTTITDLDAGTITTINNERKTYMVRTFDEMKQQMAQMQERMGGDSTPIQFDSKVKKTGKTKDIGGQTANEVILTMTAKNATDGNGMKIVSDVWMLQNIAGADEIKAFHKAMAAKMGDLMGGGNPMMASVTRAIGALRAQLGNMDGVPVETKADVSGASLGGPMAAMMGGDAADPNAVGISQTITNSGYAAGAVDDAKFAIPAGYKKAEPGQWGGPRRRPDGAGAPPQQ